MSSEPGDKSGLLLRAAGLVYAIVIESEEDSLDWLDHALLDLAEEPQPINELFASFPLPVRLLESALSRLLESNFLLLDVHDGCVRASSLPPANIVGRITPLLIWQDHATGMLIPAEQVKPWDEGRLRSKELSSTAYRRLPGGPPRKTPLEMSDAELLHRLQRFCPLGGQAMVRSRERVSRLTLGVRAQQRDDGRVAIKDSVPWPLRASWSRLAGIAEPDDKNSARLSLPARWDETVGAWFQNSYDRVRGLRQVEGSLAPLIGLLEADTLVELGLSGTLTAKRLAREAQSSLVLSVSAGHGTPGEGVQILQETSAPERILVLSGLEAKKERREEWESQGIRLIVTGARQGPDFLLADSRVLAFGGIRSGSKKIFTIRSNAELSGYMGWLAGSKVTLPRWPIAPDDLARDLRALEHDITELAGHREREVDDEELEARLEPIRSYLKGRCHTLQLRLLERSTTPIGWLSHAEVLGLVEQWSGALRVLVRHRDSPLAKTAISQGVECAVWPETDAPVDCIVTDRVTLLGFSEQETSAVPDFLALYHADLASQIRMETYKLPQLSEN